MSKKRKYRMTSYGEYEFVVNKIYSASAIKRAHETKITRGEVLSLIKKLSKRYLKNKKVMVEWLSKRESQTNWGGIVFDGRIPIIGLINTKKNLRVGIVLHEFSHAFTGYKYGMVNHGKIFIKTFNKVLKFYYKK